MTSNPDGSNIPPLSDDQRDWIRRSLKAAGVPITAGLVDRLTNLIAGGMDAFRKNVAAQTTDRERHEALRRLLKLAESRDPPIGQIRTLIKQLSARSVEDLEERAALIWNRVFPGRRYPRQGFIVWSESAPVPQLLEAINNIVPDGGVRIAGRKRPGGRRSTPTPQPRIYGSPLGANNRQLPDPSAPGTGQTQSLHVTTGRPESSAPDNLVMHLAYDWAKVTGEAPQPGRSDQTAFGGLVYHVFGWLGLDTPHQSLRRYWADVESVEITECDGKVSYS
jgi:hypothetical protein